LKELEDSSPTNEAEEQTTTTSTTRESRADVDLEISSFGFRRHGFKKYQENKEA